MSDSSPGSTPGPPAPGSSAKTTTAGSHPDRAAGCSNRAQEGLSTVDPVGVVRRRVMPGSRGQGVGPGHSPGQPTTGDQRSSSHPVGYLEGPLGSHSLSSPRRPQDVRWTTSGLGDVTRAGPAWLGTAGTSSLVVLPLGVGPSTSAAWSARARTGLASPNRGRARKPPHLSRRGVPR